MLYKSITVVRAVVCAITLSAVLAGCSGSGSSSASGSTPGSGPKPPITPPIGAGLSPKILGTPAGAVLVGQAYDFKPSVSASNGDSLTFSISSQPSWASFDPVTGHLWGTPAAGDVGSYEQIEISVSDGKISHSLPQFAIAVVEQATGSVTLAWQPPKQNTDGTPLRSLGGYKIHYGTRPGVYDSVVGISAGITRYVIENLSPGTYYFALTAVSGTGAESDLSGEASKTIS